MKKLIQQHRLKIITGLVFIVLLVLIFVGREKKVETNFWGPDISGASQITCTYPQLESVIYNDNKITARISDPEKKPIVLTFSHFKDSDRAQLSALDSLQTITNVPIVKIMDNPKKIIFIEGGEGNYFSTHTIYKKEGVGVYTKSVDIVGVPYGSLGMGTCVGF